MAPVHGEGRLIRSGARRGGWLLVFLLACGCAAAVEPPAPDAASIRTEEGLRAALDPLEARLEAACAEIGEGRWGILTGAPDGVESMAAARKSLVTVYSDPTLSAILDHWAARATVTRDPSLTRRVQMWAASRLSARIETDPGIARAADSLGAKIAAHAYTLDGAAVTRAGLLEILSRNPDGGQRRKAWLALLSAAAAWRADLHALVRARAVEASPTKARYYHHLIFGVNGLEPNWLFKLTEILMHRSALAYEALLAEMKSVLGTDRLEPWDIDYAVTRVLERRHGKAFQEARAAPASVPVVLKELGFDPRVAASRTAILAAPLAGLALPVRIPSDIRITLAGAEPTDPFSESFEEALRGWGRALPGLLVAQESPMLKGYDCLPGTRNAAWSHGMGALMASWLDDPLFAARRLGLSGGAAEALQDARRVRGLVALRRTLASAGFEFVMYVNPDADLDDRHADLYVKALGVALPDGDPPLWAGNPLLAHSPLDAHARLIGASIAAEAHAKLRESLGGDRVSRAAAAWMTEVFYSGGEQLTLDYRLARSIQGGYDLDLYLKTLGIGKP